MGNLAIALHGQGVPAMAITWQSRLLSVTPADVEGLLCFALFLGAHPLARRALRRAMAQAPERATGWAQFGDLEQGSPRHAALAYRRALAKDRHISGAWSGLATASHFGNASGPADRYSRYALVLSPDSQPSWVNRAEILAGSGRHRAAAQAAWRGLAVAAQQATAWHNLGNYYWSLSETAFARRCFQRAVALFPGFAESMSNLAAALRELALPGPLTWFRRTYAVASDSAGAMTNLGTALPPGSEESRTWHRRALVWEPAHVHALNNLGSHAMADLELSRSIAWFDRAILSGYPDAEAQWNRGVARLTQGDLPRGLADYEVRWNLRAFADQRRNFSQPVWRGEPLAGRTLLVFAEQGLGDTLQFVRYLESIEPKGGRVVLECQRELIPLLRRAMPGIQIVAKGDPLPAFDVQLPLLSLPTIFRSTLETIPKRVPYLYAGSRSAFHAALDCQETKVGLVWAGNAKHKNDSNRSMSVADLGYLVERLRLNGRLKLFSLQVGPREADLDAIDPQRLVTRLGGQLRDFEDTATVIARLDLVIGVDTSVMHLVGALGCPGWLLLPFAPDWRWLLKTSVTPWYPTLRLFRQARKGGWLGVADLLAAELAAGRV